MNPCKNLFFTFMKIGLCTFGGGYAILPVLTREIADKKGWATEAEIIDYYAIGQCTPGIIAVNSATFIGYKQHGVRGAIAATTGLVFPSLVIIIVVASCIQQFSDYPVVQHAFSGIRIAVCALVLHAVYTMSRNGVVDWLTALLLLGTFLAVTIGNLSPVLAILSAGGIGVLSRLLGRSSK